MASSTELYKFGATRAAGYEQVLAKWTGGAAETYLSGTGIVVGLGRTTGILAEVKAVQCVVVSSNAAYTAVYSTSSGGTVTVKLYGSATIGGPMTELANLTSLTGLVLYVMALAK